MANGIDAPSADKRRRDLLRTAVAVAFSLVGAVLLGLIVAIVQPKLAMEVQRTFNVEKLETIQELLDEAAEDEEDIVDNYDNLNLARADTIALYIRTVNANAGSDGASSDGFAYTDDVMAEILDRLSVRGLMVVDANGKVYCQAGDPSCAVALANAPEDAGLSAPFTVLQDDTELRFFASQIDDSHYVVIVDVPEETERYVEEVASLPAVLSGVRVGQSGFVFAVDTDTGVIVYYPDKEPETAADASVATSEIAEASATDEASETANDSETADDSAAAEGTSEVSAAAAETSEASETIDDSSEVASTGLTGTLALEAGLTREQLTEGFSGTIEVAGEEYFATVGVIDGFYIVAVNPISEFNTQRNAAINAAVVVFLFVTMLVVAYCAFARRESCRPDEAHYRRAGKLLYDLKVGRGAVPLAVAGLLIGAACIVFVQTIFSVATQCITNDSRVSEAVSALETADARVERLDSEASDSAVEKAKLAAYVIAHLTQTDSDAEDATSTSEDVSNTTVLTRDFMIELRDALQATGVWYYDIDGNTVATDGEYWGYRLSEEEDTFSYKFRKILLGRTISVVAETGTDKNGFVSTRYAGYAVQDENLATVGAFELGVQQDRLLKMEDSTSIASTLERLQIGNNGFAFAVSKTDGTFVYHPDSNLIGSLATDHGITSAQLIGGFSDYMTIDGSSYLVSSAEYDDMIIYVAVPSGNVNSRTLVHVAALGFLFSMLWLNLIVAWMTLSRRSVLRAERSAANAVATPAPTAPVASGVAAAAAVATVTVGAAPAASAPADAPSATDAIAESSADAAAADAAAADAADGIVSDDKDDDSNKQMIEVDVSEGHTVKTRSALSRWTDVVVRWENKTAGQKTFFIMRVALGLLAVGMLLIGTLGSRFLPEDSALLYILNGHWSKGLNLFGVTQCVMAIVVVYVVIAVLSSLFLWFAKSMNAKGETIFRLLANVVKFVGFIGSIYYCLGCLGVDTTTLLASAGILTVIVGLGANSIVTDILAGLLIVFEGEFQVGDIVTIGGVRGTVLEIGVRTTKIKDGSGNVKVFANRNVSDVLNMTKDYSVVALDVSVYFGGSLDDVEQQLVKSLPAIRQNIPAITNGPFYKGLDKVYGSVAEFKVVASCAESDIGQVERDLRRELQRVLKDYSGVSIA